MSSLILFLIVLFVWFIFPVWAYLLASSKRRSFPLGWGVAAFFFNCIPILILYATRTEQESRMIAEDYNLSQKLKNGSALEFVGFYLIADDDLNIETSKASIKINTLADQNIFINDELSGRWYYAPRKPYFCFYKYWRNP